MIPLSDNPKDVEQHQSKGYDTKDEDPVQIKIGLEDIDTTIINYMTNTIKPEVVQDETKIVVPVMYANSERWKGIRKDGVLRDRQNKLQIPLIAIKRNSISKNSMNSPINKYLDKSFISSGWNSRNKYDRFAIQNGIVPSSRYTSILYPDYYDISYDCIVWTEKQSQMNHVIEQIAFETENYWGEDNNFRFKTSVDEYTNMVDLPSDKDRMVRSEFTMNVKGYLLPENYVDNFDNPATTNKTLYTIKKVVITETITTG
jgi:hypothetical protein